MLGLALRTRKREEGRSKEQKQWLHPCNNSVCGPAATDSQHCQHQTCKQYNYGCCTYTKILNHVNYRAVPFPPHSCFIMKTEMNRDYRSSVLFVFCFVFFPIKLPPATVELHQEPWQRCCHCNCAVPHVAGNALIWAGGRGSNSHSHTLRWQDVAFLIRGPHLYSQPWLHLKTYATA